MSLFAKKHTKKEENLKENKEGEQMNEGTTIISYLFDENEDTTYKYVNNVVKHVDHPPTKGKLIETLYDGLKEKRVGNCFIDKTVDGYRIFSFQSLKENKVLEVWVTTKYFERNDAYVQKLVKLIEFYGEEK